MTPKNHLNRSTPSLCLITLLVTGFAFLPEVRAVNPPPGGCYPAYTTAEGCFALFSLTSGTGNTGLGHDALFTDTTGNWNTGVGAVALGFNNGDSNTAVGAGAMLLNTGGSQNVAIGTNALVFNDSGLQNSAVGAFALSNNIDGTGNNAFGEGALFENISGDSNTAIGLRALFNNDVTGTGAGGANTAVGALALYSNTDGDSNTAVGYAALNSNVVGRTNTAVGKGALTFNDGGSGNNAFGVGALGNNAIGFENQAMGVSALESNETGSGNVAIGSFAFFSNVDGSYNTVVGWQAGYSVEGSNNIYVGASTTPKANGISILESNTIRIGNPNDVNDCYIAGIVGNGPFGADVQIDPVTGRLGSNASSERFKKDIDHMGKTSEAIYSLKPVTFHYKNDKTQTPQFGLIAEEVAKVNPALIAVDKEGRPYTVRYSQINAMLLNEFLKEHRKVQNLESTVAEQQKQIKALIAGLQKVSTPLKTSKATQIVNSSR